MNKSYWNRRADTWVSFAVLAGGLVSAVLLFILVRIENRLQGLESRFDILITHELQERGLE
jgi:hypothetical protein